MCALISPSISLFSHVHKRHHIMIWYNIRCYFNMCSKAVITELNLPHGTKNWKVEIRKTKKKKSDMLRSIGKCTCDSSSLWPTHGTLMLPQFSLVDACWLSIRKLEASVQLSMDSLCGGWLPSVLTRLEPRNWLLFSTPISWALVLPVGVKLLCIRPEDTWKLSRRTMCWWSLTLAMLSTAYIGGRCFWQFTTECQSYTPSAAQLTISHPFCFLANTLFSLKRVSNKVTQLGHFSSVILFSHCCHLCIPILTLVIWTTSLWVVTLTWWLLMWRRSCESAQKWACLSTYLSASSRHTVTCN